METVVFRRADVLGKTIRRFLRRGARGRLAEMLSKVRPEDLAVALRGLTPSEQTGLFDILVRELPEGAIATLTELEPQQRLAILESFAPERIAGLLELAPVDDAVSVVESLPAELKEQVLEIVDLEGRLTDVQAHLTYADDSAGRVMDSELVALPEATTVEGAIERIREIARDVDMIAYLYVVDAAGHLLGVTSLRQLLLADPAARLGEVMNTAVIKVRTETDQEEVAQLAARYDLLAIPVTDEENRLVGIVTVDDIIDIFKEEATEDFFKLAGTSDDELVYQDRSLRVAGIRLPWLLVNLLGLLVAATVVTRFEETFQVALLVGFIPVILGMGGNIGAQTSTIAVRGIATGRLELDQGRVRHFLWQQLKVGGLIGLACSLPVALVAFFLDASPFLPAAVGTSLFITVLAASFNGVLVPVAFQRLGIDPAVASGPLVTTTNDILGMVIYFGFTALFFRLLAG